MNQAQPVRARHAVALLRPRILRNYLILALPLSVAIILFDPSLGVNLGFEASASSIVLMIAGFQLLLCLGPFFRQARGELAARKPSGAVLTSVAAVVLYGVNLAWSLGELSGAQPDSASTWWQFALAVLAILAGNWLVTRKFKRLTQVRKSLADLLPKFAAVADEQVSIDELRIGSIIDVRPGQTVPADGVVLDGSADVNEFAITGSSQWVYKAEGATVWAGSVLSADAPIGQGALQIEVQRAGSATALGAHHEMLLSAEEKPSKLQLLLDEAAGWLFYLAVVVAAILLSASLAIAPEQIAQALTAFAAMLLVFTPQNLQLVVGPVMVGALNRAAKSGLLVQDRVAFERLTKVDAIVFDKTGTLTTAERSFVRARLAHNSPLNNIDELIALAAGLEVFAQHSVASRIVAEARMRRLEIPEILDFRVIPGMGVTGILDGSNISVGGAGLLTGRNIEIFVGDLVLADQANSQGNSVIFVIRDAELLGFIELSDIIRSNAHSVVTQLHLRKKRAVLITGDAVGVAIFVANQLGIAEVYGELVPLQKAKTIDHLKADGSLVAMVGDAEHDLESLRQADIAIVVGADSEHMSGTNGLILTTDNPMAVVHAVDLSTQADRAIRSNLIWFTAAALIALLFATGTFSGVGVAASPLLSVLLGLGAAGVMGLNAAKFQK